MQPASSRGGGGGGGGRCGGSARPPPIPSAAHVHALLVTAVQRGEGADRLRARLAGSPVGLRAWPAGLSQLLHAALDRGDDPDVLAALLAHIGGGQPALVEGGGGVGASGLGDGGGGMLSLSQQLLTSALQRGDPRMVGIVLWHCGRDPDVPLPAFPRCV